MSYKNLPTGLIAGAVLFVVAAFGQDKPDFTGTWELTMIERDGRKIPAGTNFKETQIWVHQEPKLSIKILTWDATLGYRTVELAYTTNGETGMVGYLIAPDGTKNPVKGSARWDGQRLIYEQVHSNPEKLGPRRIIRTCTLDRNGPKIVAHSIHCMTGSEERSESTWTWEKKNPDTGSLCLVTKGEQTMTSNKHRIGFIALGVLGACGGAFQLWAFNPQPDPPAFAMVGIDPSATVRLNVVNIGSVPPGPCDVGLAFADSAGRILMQVKSPPDRRYTGATRECLLSMSVEPSSTQTRLPTGRLDRGEKSL